MTIQQYRALVLASLVVGLAGALMDVMIPSLLPDALHEALAVVEREALTGWYAVLLLVVSSIVLIAGLVATYGLYFLRSWAPDFSLLVTIVSLLALAVGSPDVQSSYSTSLLYLSSYLWGAVVVLAYVGPMREHFGRDKAGD